MQTGEVHSLAVDFEPDTPQFKASYRLNPQRAMVATGTDVRTGRQAAFGLAGHGFADDMVTMSLQAATQWDSLAHCFHDYHMYNGRPCELVGAKGAAANDIAVLRDRVFTRGVLADVAGHLGVDALAPDHHITVAELEATLAAQGVDVGRGDALIVRTGHLGRIQREGAWDRFVEADEPGLGWDALPWLHDRQVAAVACDNWAFEVYPSRYELDLPFHAVGIVYMGLLIGEIFALDALAEACRADGALGLLLHRAAAAVHRCRRLADQPARDPLARRPPSRPYSAIQPIEARREADAEPRRLLASPSVRTATAATTTRSKKSSSHSTLGLAPRCPGAPSGGLLPDRDVLAALAGERLAPPPAPAVAQAHPGELRHQVELGGPHVAERDRQALDAAVDDLEVVRDQALVGDVVLVEAPVALADVEGADGLARAAAAAARARRPRSRSSRPARGAPRRCGSRRPAPPAWSGS